jgi:hypothetical protein
MKSYRRLPAGCLGFILKIQPLKRGSTKKLILESLEASHSERDILINITGKDKPGLTNILAQYDVTILVANSQHRRFRDRVSCQAHRQKKCPKIHLQRRADGLLYLMGISEREIRQP